MSLFSSIVKNLNPVKLVSNLVGGTLGKVLAVATNIVTGIAQGKSFKEIMKQALKDVMVLAISAAITYFTGGTAGVFVNAVLDQAKGLLGQVAAKVATNTILDKAVSGWLSGQITKFGEKLTTDLVRKQLTSVVLDVTGLKDDAQQLEANHLALLQKSVQMNDFLGTVFEQVTSPSTQGATLASLGGTLSRPVDSFSK
jgi:hypothetical protein